MSWSYSGNPATSDRDAVRYFVQDTNRRDQLATNEDIDFELSQYSSVLAAAVAVANTILADMVRRNRTEKEFNGYKMVVDQLRQRLSAGAVGYAGGISDSDKETRNNDDNRVKPAFTRTSVSYSLEDDC